MMLVDVHAHLDFPDYEKDLDEVIRNNKAAGVGAIICNGVSAESNRKVLALAKKYDIIKPSLGIYPVHVADMPEQNFDEELEFISKQKIVAIGEVGLDYLNGDDNPHGNSKELIMKKCFEKFIGLAERKNLPIICHSRRAELDVIEMLESSNAKKVVMHCFMGRKHLVKRILDNGWSLSIPCIIGKLQQFQDNVALAPIGQILTETDAPYMSPFPETRRNEPMFIEGTIKKIAEIKSLDETEAGLLIFNNYQRLFL
jgi:TatD DNase family protein